MSQEISQSVFRQQLLKRLRLTPASLQRISPRSRRSQYRAALNWLIHYEAPSPDSKLDQVRGYLEAFRHLAEVEDWQRCQELLLLPLESLTGEPLHRQLEIWGYYQEQMEMYILPTRQR